MPLPTQDRCCPRCLVRAHTYAYLLCYVNDAAQVTALSPLRPSILDV